MHKLSLLVDPSDHDEVRAVWKLHAHADRCPLSDLFDHFRETQRSRNRIAVKIFRGVQSVLQEAVLVASIGQRIVATVRWSRGYGFLENALNTTENLNRDPVTRSLSRSEKHTS